MNTTIKSAILTGLLGVSSIAITTALATPASAQVTSSAINGQVLDNGGQAVANANVTIIHVPSGSTKSVTTSANGVFFASGLRVGGPYSVSVTSTSGNVSQDDVRLRPATNSLRLIVGTADEIIVTGVRAEGLNLNNGVGSAFSGRDILNQPTTQRDLIATLLRDPLSNSSGEGNLSVAGANPRFNALAIDGSLQTDDFGLSGSSYATARSPISLDVVESASIVASDYSVTNSGFTGGLINVVTKSGTNEINGAGYFYYQDESFYGNRSAGTDVATAAFTEKEYGLVLSGPIVKDKLFFLASYDEFQSGSGRNFVQSDIDNNINPAIYDGINQIVQTTFGYDMGGRPDTVSLPVTSKRLLGKIDWNIDDNHRASFTYQNTKENGFSGVGSRNFQSSYYETPSALNAYTGQLFSDWSDNLSTNLRVNYKEFERAQNCNAGVNVGQFEIRLSEADLVGTALQGFLDDGDANTAETQNVLTLIGGCDRFRQGNTFADSRLQVFGSANYNWGDHLFTFGAEFQSYQLDNLFAQRSSGLFRYESIVDLQAGLASRVDAQSAASGNREDIRAVWGYDQLALFAQDSWQALPNFRLDYGVRYEVILQSDRPQERTFFEAAYGFSNTQNLDGNSLFMPRIGFEYLPFDSTNTKVSGGIGLYGGGDPKVWTSAAFSPPVFFVRQFNVAGTDPTAGLPPALLAAIQANSPNDPGPIDVISPDFKTPSDWKASLRIDHELDMDFGYANLGKGYNVSLQALYVATNNGFRWENLAQTQLAATSALGTAPDGRPIYADLDDLDINNAIALTNFNDGSSLILSASIAKEYENGLGFYLSYANQNVNTSTPGTSSRGVSNFRAIVDSDRNNPSSQTSPFQIEHAFKVGLSYENEIIGDLNSRFSLFGQITSGDAFSYTFDVARSNALFGRAGDGESPFDNDLLYVPTINGGSISDANVVLGSGFDEAGFITYAEQRGLTQGIQERNAGRSPWNQRWDFQWQQELPFFNEAASKYVGENRLKFVLDIQNVLNLVDSDWGTQVGGPRFGALGIVRSDLVSAADVALNGIDGATALTGDAPRTTCLSAGDCVYRFTDFDADPSGFRSLSRSVYQVRMGLRFEF
ncbi:MAG: TonB-dependent receptor [Robiginitomaculum sp.]|nr:TonB-dependent receptor [Robiginitomaculum sp.]